MRKIYFPILVAAISISTSCDSIFNKTIHGNGNVSSEQRNSNSTDKIKSYGSFDVVIIQGSTPSVKVEADENLLPYIVTENKDGALVIRAKEHYNLSSDNKILVTVTTDKLSLLEIAGSGNVSGQGKFTGSEHLEISVAGTGNVKLDINTPEINSEIAGTGSITLSGETKDSKIDIAGVGDYYAENLMSENVEISIAGSGNAKVYAESNLDIHIAGSGDVSYRGNATVKQDIAGSGKINKVN